jgi:hypothetical protein
MFKSIINFTGKQFKDDTKPTTLLLNELDKLYSSTLWEPLPLKDQTCNNLFPVKPLYKAMLPEPFVEYVFKQAYCFNNTKPDYIAVSLLVCSAGLIGQSVVIIPKKNDEGWRLPIGLWALLVGNSGVKKSPALKTGLKFLKETCQSPDNEASERVVSVNDATVEALRKILSDNTNGVVFCRDELSSWFLELNKNDNAGSRTFFLEAFDGDGQFDEARIGRQGVKLDNFIVSLLGGIQPSKLNSILNSRASNTNNDGLFERMQLSVFPDNVGAVYTDEKLTDNHMIEVKKVFSQLYKLESIKKKFVLRFDLTAQIEWNNWNIRHLERMQLCTELDNQFLDKYPALLARLSSVIHLVQEASFSSESEAFEPNLEIAAKTLQKALLWLDYLWSHNRKIINHAFKKTEADQTEYVISRLKKLGKHFSLRNFQRVYLSGSKSKAEVIEVISQLKRQRIIKQIEISNSKGKTNIWYLIHPTISNKNDEGL